MCIAILNTKKLISESEFMNCWDNNPDGFGMAWIEKSEIRIFKELINDLLAYDRYKEIRKSNNKPILLHFRIATHGMIDLANCHPFRIDNNTVFAHNGIIDIHTTKTESDTIAFNNQLLKKLPIDFIFDKTFMKLIEMAIGNSKLVFLHASGKFRIANNNLGLWKSENWYSNESFKQSKYIYTDYTKLNEIDESRYNQYYPEYLKTREWHNEKTNNL